MLHYFRITVFGGKPKSWEREFEVEGHTSGDALVLLLVYLSALSQERLLRMIHIGAPYDEPVQKNVLNGVFEFPRKRVRSSAVEQPILNR